MLLRLLFLFACITQFYVFSFAQPISEARPFYLGHSLVNQNIPAFVHGLALDAGKTTAYDYQLINGAPLSWQFNNSAGAQGTPYTTAFPQGNHDVFVLTEAVPLQNHLTWNNTYGFAADFLEYAIQNNNAIPVRYYMYETWHCTNTGIHPPGCEWDNGDSLLWHPRLISDWPLWTGIVDHVRNEFPGQEVWMIPAGQAWHALVNEIENGNLPGITSFQQLFTDDIHLTNAGNYFVACVMFACIYRENPVGLTTAIVDAWGGVYPNMPSPAQAAIMQQVAWTTALNVAAYSGVDYFLSTHSVAFHAQMLSEQVRLSASTESNSGLKEIVFTHSTDGVAFFDLQSFAIHDNSAKSIDYIHHQPPAGVNYYRLRSLDLDGSVQYSNIKALKTSHPQFSIFPNPVHSGLNIKSNNAAFYQVKLFNHSGILVFHGKDMDFIDMGSLPAGIYSISISSDNLIERHKVIHIGN